MKKRLIPIGLSLCLGLSPIAMANQLANRHIYAGAQGGFSFISGEVFSQYKWNDHYSTGYNVGGHIGYQFDNGLRLEGMFMYLAHQPSDKSQHNIKISAWDLMANAIYQIKLGYKIQPFVGAGLGVTIPDISLSNFTTSDSKLAYQAIAGVEYSIDNAISLNINYHFVAGGKYAKSRNLGHELTLPYYNLLNLGVNYYF